jgi:Bacteriophage tail sheath protein
MAVQVSYPGVYIDEFAPGAPIQGVSTSNAAFIGPASRGDLDTPTKLASWDAFQERFGPPVPGFFMWYAVRGYFQNGGQICYIVRASNGEYARLTLQNRGNHDMAEVRAREPGDPTPPLQVEIVAANVLQSADWTLFQPTGTFTVTQFREIQLASPQEAAQFRPGDWVNLGATDPRVQVSGGSGDRLRFGRDLAAAVGGTGNIRLADTQAGNTTTVRVAAANPATQAPAGALVQGTMLTIAQTAGGATVTDTQVVESVQSEPLQSTPARTTYRVTFRQPLRSPFSLDPANPATVQSEEFHFRIHSGTAVTPYDNLALDASHPRYFATIINAPGGVVQVEPKDPPPPDLAPNNLPDDIGPTALASGKDEDLSNLADTDYIDALDTLRRVDDVNIIAIPDATIAPKPEVVQQAVIAHCEQMQDRFGVLDSKPGLQPFEAGAKSGVDVQRRALDSTRGYVALYYPWLRVPPAGRGASLLVPPSGHVCGIMAKVDNSRGVFKAPANVLVNGAFDIQRNGNVSNEEQGQLNLAGINVLRVFQSGERPMLWGARTTATDLNWLYVNVRRLFLFLEESIQEGIRYAVFEPNDLGLWQRLKQSITAFLTQQWRDGALFGATPEDAFYVRIDEVLNPFSEQALGRLHIEIGVRPTYPAEFIIVRIGISPGGSEVTEG